MKTTIPTDLIAFLKARALPKRLFQVGLALSSVYSLRPEQLLAKSTPRGGAPQGGLPGEGSDAPLNLPVAPLHSRDELFFVDAAVADPGAFWLAAPQGAFVMSIPAGVDSWEFMAQEAGKLQSVGAIHIVSHGEPGALLLNGRRYTAADLESRLAPLARLGRALTKNGDIFLYGCSVGAGTNGRKFLDTLAAATGADVAASSDVTGGTARGGNWDLEITTGTLHYPDRINKKLLADYDHLLVTSSVSTVAQLKAAIVTGNTDGVPDVITVTGNITFASAADVIAINVTDGQTMTIVGGGFTLSGNNLARVLDVNTSGANSAVAISNLTISNGFVTGAGGNRLAGAGGAGADSLGAAIRNAGNLTITNSTITGSKAAGGGGAGGDTFNGSAAGAGGGGGGFGSTFGGTGGTNFGYATTSPSAGTGGNGSGYTKPGGQHLGGLGGTASGGAGANYGGYSFGGAGGTANNGSIGIGGGGGGGGYDAAGGRGGNAVGGIYNTGTLIITGGSITNNIGAGGGGGGGGTSAGVIANPGGNNGVGNGGNGGSGTGALWNAGGTVHMDAGTFATMSTTNAAGAGSGGAASGGSNVNGSSGTATSQILTTGGGTTDTAYNPNVPPVATASGGTTAFTEGNNITSTPVAIDSGITVTDSDNSTLASATVSITGNFHGSEDALAFTNNPATMGNISGSYNSGTGVLTLTSSGATATVTQWQATLRSVTYTNSSDTPNTSNRTISFVANDGTANSNTTTKTVSVTSVNDAPIATASGGNTAFTEGNNVTSTPVAVDSGLTVTDADSTTLASATVSITGNFQGSEDSLAFTNNPATMGNISGSYNSGTGVLTLTSSGATATVAQWQAALRNVTYTNSSDSPNTSNRTISFVANDGSTNSGTTTKTVTVASTNDAPIVTTSGGTTAFTEGNNVTSTPVAVDSGLTVTDADNTTLASGTVSITGNFHSAEDVLAFTNNPATMGNISGSYNSGTGVLTLTSSGATATLAQWQAALRSVTYTNSSDTPNTSNRTISFAVNDGISNSSTTTKTVSVTSTNDSPIATASGGNTAFTEGNNVTSTPVVVDSGLTLSDVDNTTLASATVSITGNLHSSEDALAFTNNPATMGNISGSYNTGTGVLTLSSSGATATLAQWQAALRSVTYTNSSDTPNTSNRTISFVVNDGSANSGATTKTVTVASTNDAPVVTTSGGTTAFTEGNNVTSTPVAVDNGLTLNDADNTTLASATVSITGNLHSSEDALVFTNNPATMGNITGSYNSGTGVLTLTSSGATATLAQWQAALRSVTYTNSSDTPNTSNRTISFTVNDGTADGNTATKTVSVASVNDTPIVTVSGGITAATASTAVAVDSGLTVSDPDSTTLASATVSITGNFHNAEDVLAFTNNPATMGNISGSYNSATGVLTLTSSGATATTLQWQAALGAVTYTDTSSTPNTSNRTISFVVNDGNSNSSAAAKTVSVSAVNHAPTLSATGGTSTYTENGSAVDLFSGVSISTVDSGQTIIQLVLTINNLSDGSSEILRADGTDITLTNGNSGTTATNSMTYGVTIVSGTATVTLSKAAGISSAAATTLVDALSYRNGSDSPTAASRAITLTSIQDNGGTANGGADTTVLSIATTVTVTAVNDAPTITAPGSIAVTEDVATALTGISFADVDAGGASETVTLSVGSGTLAATSGGGITVGGTSTVRTLSGTIANLNSFLAAGNVTFTPATNATANVTLTIGINDGGNTGTGGAQTASATVTLSVTAVNDAPVNSVPGPQSLPQDSALTFNAGNSNLISISDVDAGGGNLQITLTATHGTITLSGTSGLSFSVGSGSGDSTITFTGTLSSINSALNGLIYTPSGGYYGSASLQITTNDQGNTGSGGAQTDTDSVGLTVVASNLPPTDISLSGNSLNRSAAANAIVGTLNSTDIDSVSFTYTLVSGTGSTDNASFNITGSTLRVNNPSLLTAGAYSIRIRTVDDHAGIFEKAFSITVVDDIDVWEISASADFDGDGQPDILWTNKRTGGRSIWLMNGVDVAINVFVQTVPIEWTVSATGDFNGDGKADIFWTNTVTGDRSIWLMDGTSISTGSFVAWIPTEWHVSGTGDFDGDGKADVLWTNTITGERSIWLMNGIHFSDGSSIGTVPLAWQVSGIGDFNGDGKSDILWSNTVTGDRAMWLMNRITILANAFITTIPVEWTVSGTGDFNGDGKSDIFWTNTATGDRVAWLMNGSTASASKYLGTVPVAWKILNTNGDYNVDKKADIFWTNTDTNQRSYWLMNGTTVIGGNSH